MAPHCTHDRGVEWALDETETRHRLHRLETVSRRGSTGERSVDPPPCRAPSTETHGRHVPRRTVAASSAQPVGPHSVASAAASSTLLLPACALHSSLAERTTVAWGARRPWTVATQCPPRAHSMRGRPGRADCTPTGPPVSLTRPNHAGCTTRSRGRETEETVAWMRRHLQPPPCRGPTSAGTCTHHRLVDERRYETVIDH